MFEQDWNELNEIQKQVASCIDTSCLVMAAAGTGKTKVIALRTRYLLENNVLPTQILCLTFTNKAAREMGSRIAGYEPNATKDITIKTFHSFCYYLIQNEKKSSHFIFPCTIMDEQDSLDIVTKIIEALPGNIKLQGKYVLTHIENIKRHSLEFEEAKRYEYPLIVADYIAEQKISEGALKHNLLPIFMRYQKALKDNNCVDFMDLIVETTYLLEQEGIKKRWNKRYQYIQVDEMQDTSKREYSVIKALALKNNLCMFGDLNQTIYEWRGSSPWTMTADFKDTFSPKLFVLNTNYRSTQILLKAANNYIRNSSLEPIYCDCHSLEYGTPIEIMLASNKASEFNKVAQAILKEPKENLENMAILTRTNDYAAGLYITLAQHGIPCSKIEDTKLFRKKEVKDLLAFFEYCINPRHTYAINKIARHPAINMEEWLLKALRRTRGCYLSLHDWFSTEGIDPYHELFKGYRHNSIVVLDVETTGLDTTKDDIIQIAAIRYGEKGVQDTLDILVKPTKSVGDSYYVHGFSDAELEEKGVSQQIALRTLLSFIKNAVIVGHNVKYDLQIINSSLYRYELLPVDNKWVYDTLDLAQKIYPNLENHKLSTLSALVETNRKPSHNALDDILATSEVLTHFIGILETTNNERYHAFEQFYPYVAEYAVKIRNIKETMLECSPMDSISYLMNDGGFKNCYSEEALKSIKDFYRSVKELYIPWQSFHDNIINLLTFSSLHHSELEQAGFFKGKLPIMTVHQAKGLEFDKVYIVGCNDRVFPTSRSIRSNNLSEEKRLFYVAMTRARKKLCLTYNTELPHSHFIDEIGEDFKVFRQN
ncbi:MAG: ATP-dependent helicase [Cellulosilyticaceae bacterium]